MSVKNVMGIIFANVHDDLIPELASNRSMASVPFGGRYRLIDFSLSNLVNAGISKVGILTKNNYHSLMDHLGSGKPWDLDRKKGGMFILPPFNTTEAGIYRGHVDALAGVMTFLRRSREEYVVMCDADIISNIDIEAMVQQHLESGSDVTFAVKKGMLPVNHRDTMIFDIDENNLVSDISVSETRDTEVDFCLDIFVIKRELLIDLVTEADRDRRTSISRDVFKPNVNKLKMSAYRVDSFAEVVDSAASYVKISKMLLEPEVRRQLFNPDRPVYTKTRDDMPSRYGFEAEIKNSLIADGCIIEGTVKNSILFRGVTVDKGAVVENCIVMQGSTIGENCKLSNITMDKNSAVSPDIVMSGTADRNIFVPKGRTV